MIPKCIRSFFYDGCGVKPSNGCKQQKLRCRLRIKATCVCVCECNHDIECTLLPSHVDNHYVDNYAFLPSINQL